MESMDPHPTVRPRSFVLRGRRTESQQRAIDRFWDRWGVDFDSEILDLDSIFSRRAPRSVEIGFGDGENLLARAGADPDRDFLGIEVHAAGVGRVLAEIDARQLSNVRIIRHDAVEVFESGLDTASIDELLVFFPDPWPKARHHRRRLIRPDIVAILSRALAVDGVFRLATDWEPYATQMFAVLDAEPLLYNVAGSGQSVPRPAQRPITKFERRGVGLGHSIVDLEYRRR